MYTLFLNLTSGEFFSVSRNSLDYVDFDAMTSTGHLKKIMEGSRKECQQEEESLNN